MTHVHDWRVRDYGAFCVRCYRSVKIETVYAPLINGELLDEHAG